jgi:hypothetical protein
VLFAYVDESANKRHYRTVALVLDAERVSGLAEALDAVMAGASAAYKGVGREFEFHGHDLFGATEEWAVLKSAPRARIGIYRDALQAIAGAVGAVFIEGLDRGLKANTCGWDCRFWL